MRRLGARRDAHPRIHFQDYAQELAEECDMVPDNITWPCDCIDWEKAARELRYDYSEIEFDDITYLIRS
jgi:hypothetical protein